MFALNISLNNVAWRLLFKEETEAKDIFDALRKKRDAHVTIEDDFGQTFHALMKSIQGVMFEDLNKSKLAHVEMFLHQKRMEAMAMKAAQTDPALRASNLMNGSGGLAVFDPMGMMPRN